MNKFPYYKLIVEADYNDGDYVTEETTVSEKEIKWLRKMAKILESHKYDTNWDDPYTLYKGQMTDKDIESLNDYVPAGPDSTEVHSITAMKIYKIASEEELL